MDKDDWNFADLERYQRVAGALSLMVLNDWRDFIELHSTGSGELALEVFASLVDLQPGDVRTTFPWPDAFEMQMLVALTLQVEATCREPGRYFKETTRFKQSQSRLFHKFTTDRERAFGALAECGLIETDGFGGQFAEWNETGRGFISGIVPYERSMQILCGARSLADSC
jgi:hypothetical protein